MATLLVLSADRWNMQDENTGRKMSGISIWCVNKHREATEEQLGYKPVKMSVDESLWPTVSRMKLPAICRADLDLKPGPKGVASVTVLELELIRDLDLFAAPAAGAKK